MILAIVGTRTVPDPDIAHHLIAAALAFGPSQVISGGAPGIDQMVANMCRSAGFDFVKFRPENQRWEPDGYKARNIAIASECDVLVAIRSRSAETFGSGWTANEAERRGQQVYRWEMP